MTGLAAYANDARVAIDTFQTDGTTMKSQASRVFAISSLRNISELTGGRASIREDIGKSLSRVNEGIRMGYLLGYYPNDENWNGEYRRIDVKVNRPGLRVAFRHGYFAGATVRSYNRQEFLAFDRISATLHYTSDLGDIPFVFTAIQTVGAARRDQGGLFPHSLGKFSSVGDLFSSWNLTGMRARLDWKTALQGPGGWRRCRGWPNFLLDCSR